MRTPRTTRLLLTAAVCAVLASATAADVRAAQVNRGPGNGPWQSTQSREAYDRGFREGLRLGENHGRNNRDFNFEREGAYRSGDQGYDQRFGSRDSYRVEFRRGFAAGYREAYDRFRIVVDGHDRDRYDPIRHSDYREADQGYYRDYGSKDVYRNNYRNGFRQGYENGYRDGGRR